MGWRDLLTEEAETIVAPWMGGRSLHSDGRTRTIAGTLPCEHGWYQFQLGPRRASFGEAATPQPETLGWKQCGYLVGDRFVPDHAPAGQLRSHLAGRFARVHLLEEGLERFARIEVGALRAHGRLVYRGLAFPLGPEADVLSAFLDKGSLCDVRGVIPSLQAAFDLECNARRRAEERRERLVAERTAAAEAHAKAAHRRHLERQLSSGLGRRAMAAVDMHSAVAAALCVAGADLLDIRDAGRGEHIVRYRLDGRRFECVCDAELRIIDSGVCLTDDVTGEKGDTYFTLESLPAVIRQADREGVLVVYRHG